MNFLEIDIVQNPGMVQSYLSYLDAATARVIQAGAIVGALQTRVAIQADFTSNIIAAINRGIGHLVDADMNEESTRLKALQAQEQLAVQALSIANETPDLILQLFN